MIYQDRNREKRTFERFSLESCHMSSGRERAPGKRMNRSSDRREVWRSCPGGHSASRRAVNAEKSRKRRKRRKRGRLKSAQQLW
jgi:hypothetical protein